MFPMETQFTAITFSPSPATVPGLVPAQAGNLSVPGLTKVDFQMLSAFDRVRDQYDYLGVRFEGAIALEPSNPLFQPIPRVLVLMPLTNPAGITAYFRQPANRVSVRVCIVRPIVLSAYDRDGHLIEQVSAEWEPIDSLEDQDGNPLPEQIVELQAPNIAKVVVQSYSPFVLSQFSFS